MTEETKLLMVNRDQLKQKARELSYTRSWNWKEFKILRNKINNKKKQDEKAYKSEKIAEAEAEEVH